MVSRVASESVITLKVARTMQALSVEATPVSNVGRSRPSSRSRKTWPESPATVRLSLDPSVYSNAVSITAPLTEPCTACSVAAVTTPGAFPELDRYAEAV